MAATGVLRPHCDWLDCLAVDAAIQVGTPVASLFDYYEDWIYEIGLTPNRMDAMSHYGVAKDVCAYLSYHENPVSAKSPYGKTLNIDQAVPTYKVTIEDQQEVKELGSFLEDYRNIQDELDAYFIQNTNRNLSSTIDMGDQELPPPSEGGEMKEIMSLDLLFRR